MRPPTGAQDRIRTYLPVAPDQVRALLEAGVLEHPGPVFVVTEDARRADPDGGVEDWEDAALHAAAVAALGAGGPVAVLAADLDGVDPTAVGIRGDERAPSQIAWSGTVRRRDLASVHLGEDVLAGPGVVDPEDALDLSWYDAGELADVAALLARHRSD